MRSAEPERIRLGVRIPMRDAVALAADVYFPEDGPEGGPYPAVLTRTPYGKAQFVVEATPLTEAGYVVVVQDVRGRHDSDGTWTPYFHEGPDGFDSVEWVAAQSWCDGNVGMIGASYGGWTQWAAARERPPHLRTFVSSVCCALWTGEWPWVNGILWGGGIEWLHRTAGRVNQPLEAYPLPPRPAMPQPLRRFQERFGGTLPMADEWLRHPTPDDYWAPITLSPADFSRIELPVLHMTGWFDGCQRSAHWLYEQMREHSPAGHQQALVVGAWDHVLRNMQRSYDGVDFGSDSVIDYHQERIRWFDHWLRGSGSAARGARVFVTGRDEWVWHEHFPPSAGELLTWFLGDGGLSLERVSVEGSATYRYDPCDPLPTRPPDLPASYPSLRRETLHGRPDVIVFTSPPLTAQLRIAGRPEVELWTTSSALDTDWFVEIADVAPDGSAFLVGHGQLRARFRNGLDKELLVEPGAPTRICVELTPRAHELEAGHRLRLAVTSSAAPLWEPNPNTGGDIVEGEGWRVADNCVLFGGRWTSRLVLPVSPGVG